MKKNLFLVAQAATLIKPFGFFSRVLSQWSRTAMFLFYFLFITLVGGQEIDAQIFCGLPDTTSTYNPSSGGLEIISTNGARLNLEDILVPANRQQLNTCMYDAATNGGNFNFEVDFGDSYGVGFNANTPHADSMRAVICQVLKDLSFFLQASPTCEGTLPTLRVLIASGSQGPNPSGAFALASAASYFYNHSNATMSSSGIMHTSAWRVLNGGDEPTTLPLVVGQAVYHTKIWYNSHPNLHYNLDMGQPYTNSVAHYDLYQITLHEMLHALGIASAIDSGGHSKINDSNQNYELYTRFDSYLFDTLMNPIVPNADNCFQTQCIPSAPLMGGCEYIMFNNNNNPNLWIYTPTDWQEGSSLSHFGDTCQTDSYVMHYKINTASAAIRRPHPDETKVLCAIGYATTDRYGDGSLDFHTHQDSEGNWTINPTVPCGNISAGNDDEGIGCDGKYIFQCLPDTIRIADLLANDRGVDTATATITCFRSIRGNIDYTLNDGLLIINNASTGLNVLTYLPTNPNTGEHTNATNVYFYVQPCMDNCTLTEDCNVVCNPSLYLPQCTGVPMPNPGGLSCATTNYSWGNATQTPDYTEDLFYTSIDPGIFRIIVSYGELPYYSSEAFMGSVNVAANKKYITMVRKKIDNSNPLLPHDVGRIHLILTDEIPPPPDMLMPIGLMAIEEHNITNTTWNTALSCFTADQDYHTLFVCAARDTAGQLSASLLFDRIDIIPDNFPSDTTLINHAACNTVLGLGDSTLCMPIEQIRYQWQQQDNNSNNWNTIAGATTPYWEVTTDSTASCTWYRLIRYVDTANNYAAPVAPTANGACIADTAYYQICVGDTLHIVGNTVICQGGTTILSADIIGNYTWSNGASTQTITVSMAGTYTVTVTNGQGCTATAATAVVLNPLPNANITGNTTICSGQSTTLTATGGGTYTWSNGASTQTITVSMAGTYTVTVTNAQGCTATATATVTVNPLPNITTTTIQPTCGLNNGSISVTPTNGTYAWTGGLSGSNPTGVAAGTYTVTVTSGACQATTSVTLSPSSALVATATTTQPTCGLNNGSISVTPTNGIYNWTGGLSGSNPTGVAAGIYTVTVTSGACQATTSVTLSPSSPLVATATTTQPTCGLNNGSISVTPTNGTYAWTGGLSGSNPTGVAAGIYTVTVTSGACQATTSVTLSPSSPLVATATATQPTCGLNNGSISVTPTNGTYAWTGGLSGSNPTGVASGIYTVTVTSGACQATTSVMLNSSQAAIANITGNTTICSGQSTTLTATGGGTYAWSNNVTTQTITVSTAGTYTVTVTNGQGCSATATATVVLNPSPTVAVFGNTTICAGETTTLNTTVPLGGIVNYAWSNGNAGSSNTVNTAGTYTVTVTALNGCTATAITNVTVNPTPNITISTACLNNQVQLNAAGGIQYVWNTGATNATILVPPTIGTSFGVTGDNAFGCANSASITLSNAQTNCPCVTPPNFVDLTANSSTISISQLVTLGILPAASATNASVFINGTLVVDQSYTFVDSQIAMAPDATIRITSGFLRLTGTHVFAPCQFLWNSIVAEAGTGFISEADGTTPTRIEDGIYAVTAHNNTRIDIKNTIFENNFIGFYVPQNNGIFQYVDFASNCFGECQFIQTADILPSLTASPVATVHNALLGQGLVVIPNTHTWAGICVNDLKTISIAGKLDNDDSNSFSLFHHLTKGIVADHLGTINVSHCRFEDILQRNTYPSVMIEGCGIFASRTQLTQGGMGEDMYSFKNCHLGVKSLRTRLAVSKNRMEQMYAGVVALLNINADEDIVIGGNVIRCSDPSAPLLYATAARRGISLLNNQNMNITIGHNNITLNHAPNDHAIGIEIVQIGTVPSTTIYENEIDVLQGRMGIRCLNTQNAHIRENTLRFHIPNPTDQEGNALVAQFGIRVEGGGKDRLNCNDIQFVGSGTAANNRVVGIQINAHVKGAYSCNLLNNTNVGMRFVDFCGNSTLRGNSFGNHHTGLQLSQTAVIGQQNHQGNTWTGTYSQVAAWHESSDLFLIQASQFKVNPVVNPAFMPPSIIAAAPWFIPDIFTTTTAFSCGEEPDCANLLAVDKYTQDDKKFAVGEIDFTVFDQELNKLGDQALYEKLRENPDLLNGQPTAISFKTSKDGTVVDDLYSLKTASQALTGEEMLKNQLHTNQVAIEGVLQQLAISDSLYQLPNADITLLDIQRIALKEQLHQLLTQKDDLYQLATEGRIDVTNQLLNQNSLITAASELQVANEKITNDLYFSTYARGNYDLNSSQIALLQSIANQCPITGGRGVYAARSLYESIEPTTYDDEAICGAIGISQKSDMQDAIEKYFAIAPNPTDGDISFVAKQTCEEATQVEIYNALGQQLAVVILPAYQTSITANLSYLGTGIYFVQIKQNNTLLQTDKLTLIH